MTQINGDKKIVDVAVNKNHGDILRYYIASDNKLQRSPKQDTFAGEIKEETDPSLKYKIMTAVSTAATVGMGAIAVIKGKKVSKLTSQLAESAEKIAGQSKTIEELSSQVSSLMSKVTELSSDDSKLVEDAKSAVATKIKKSVAANHLEAPVISIPNPLDGAKKVFNMSELAPLTRAADDVGEMLNTPALRKQFEETGKLEIFIDGPVGKIAGGEDVSKYSIGDRVLTAVEQKQSTNISIEYGDVVDWTDQKIARDMLQNFYDGHGRTLNGVSLSLQRLENGKIKVQIMGKGLFKPGDITLIGGGSKIEDPFNAGGFGEGAKVMTCKMIREGKTDNVRFRCADWAVDFYADFYDGDNVLARGLSKTGQPLNGNTIEFETADKGLADALIDAVNYFNHSKNPDYRGLSFASDEFSFKVLEQGQKGNAYLTQRFEVGTNGNWDGALDGIGVIFSRKPDAAELKEITGYNGFAALNRDRTSLSADDIQHLTHYFSHRTMSDEDLIRSIISTKHMWADLKPDSTQYSFIKGLLSEARNRGIGLDLGGERYAYAPQGCEELVLKSLVQKGYTLLPKEFAHIKIPNAEDVFRSMSVHKALQPTEIEAKKMALLDEAVGVVVKNIDSTIGRYLNNPPSSLFKADFEDISSVLDRLEIPQEALSGKVDAAISAKLAALETLTPEENAQVLQQAEKLIQEKIKTLVANKAKGTSNREAAKRLIEVLERSSRWLKPEGEKYLLSLKNLTLIEPADITRPKYIFDRHSELAKDTLGEAIINRDWNGDQYMGHWIDRSYFETANFNQIFATWLHEIHHKVGGDGSSAFTYALTDLIEVLLATNPSRKAAAKLTAINQMYDELLEQGKKAVT